MARGDLYAATAAGDDAVHYVDTGMYDVAEYGAVYVVASDRPAIVDAGMGTHVETVLAALSAVGIDPDDLATIALTHVHLDHAGGAGYLIEECPNADVYVHEIGAPHLANPDRLWEGTKRAVGDQIDHYVEPRPVDEDRIVALSDGDAIDLGDRTLAVHHAPGHAPHQVAFFESATGGLFVGDAAGIHTPATDGPLPTTPPPDFDLEASRSTLERLQGLDPTALYYPHFGDVEAGDRLARYGRNLTEWVESIADARAELADDEAVREQFLARPIGPAAWGEEKRGAETRMNVDGVLTYLDRRGA